MSIDIKCTGNSERGCVFDCNTKTCPAVDTVMMKVFNCPVEEITESKSGQIVMINCWSRLSCKSVKDSLRFATFLLFISLQIEYVLALGFCFSIFDKFYRQLNLEESTDDSLTGSKKKFNILLWVQET